MSSMHSQIQDPISQMDGYSITLSYAFHSAFLRQIVNPI